MAIRQKDVIRNGCALGNRDANAFFTARQRAGFSLVEVVIALAVIASALLVVFGLLGVGLNTFHQSKAITVSSEIAQQVYSQLESIQFNSLVSQTGGPTRATAELLSAAVYTNKYSDGNNTISTLYFDEQGNEIGNSNAGSPPSGTVYWVNVRIIFPSPMPPYTPANAVSPYLNGDVATVLVQVASNPGGVPLTYDSTNTEWTGQSLTGITMQIANYQFYVNRNS